MKVIVGSIYDDYPGERPMFKNLPRLQDGWDGDYHDSGSNKTPQDEIIAMAREAGGVIYEVDWCFEIENLERFAALVAAHEREKQTDHSGDITNLVKAAVLAEREACAKVCDDIGDSDNGYGCAAAIRARGEK